ncbi:unnamed protein product [Protopolystoma xenopodis]|uniref:ATP synthase F1 complex delta/epsilon subunit N-terminal domain-containing protein n=1 Tax=Protopolystoma xenopodis TaxID=117903 RepID=A0A448X1Q1_9PLAT|nr:unnamed protein product [Protopolystoma xenopodis]
MIHIRSLPRLVSPFCRRMSSSSGTEVPSNELTLSFGSPYKVFYDRKIVKQVDIPGLFAYSGIVKDHVPFITALRPGVIQVIEDDGASNKFFVSSGTATFNADSSMQILAEEACTLDALDASLIAAGLQSAQDQMASAKDDVTKAEAQIAVEAYESLARAAE